MEEIKTMLDTPDATPEIFKTYLDWLEQQTVQFQNLKRAADQVCVDSLSGIDPLVRSLSATAAGMPLPQMDVKPNFRRIDAMEEPPRHMEPQVNFDETVPSARVMRQMNLALDKEKGNNINIAFGQYNELRRKETWAPGALYSGKQSHQNGTGYSAHWSVFCWSSPSCCFCRIPISLRLRSGSLVCCSSGSYWPVFPRWWSISAG